LFCLLDTNAELHAAVPVIFFLIVDFLFFNLNSFRIKKIFKLATLSLTSSSTLPLSIQPPERGFGVFVVSAVEDGDASISGLPRIP